MVDIWLLRKEYDLNPRSLDDHDFNNFFTLMKK